VARGNPISPIAARVSKWWAQDLRIAPYLMAMNARWPPSALSGATQQRFSVAGAGKVGSPMNVAPRRARHRCRNAFAVASVTVAAGHLCTPSLTGETSSTATKLRHVHSFLDQREKRP
jgi:hypothetical protein